MYDNSAKTFWISFITSLFVSTLVVFIMTFFIIPNVSFFKTENQEMKKIEVPQLEGINYEKAKIIASNKDLVVFVESEKTSDRPKNTIISQSPLPGAMVEKNSVINVVISAGPEIVEEKEPEPKQTELKKVVLPHYAGLNIDDVQRDIIRLNLRIGDIKYIENDKYAADVVIKTLPVSGSEIAEHSSVDIYVSKGIGSVIVPNVFRLSKYNAISKIRNAGLTVSQTYYTTSEEYPFDIVIRQEPKAGSRVKKGSDVKIWINRESQW